MAPSARRYRSRPVELIGRDAERERLRAFVEGGRGALVIAGRPGVGKSALLDATIADPDTDRRVLRAIGVQSEITLPFAGLRELLDPVLAEVDALPATQRHALRGALALDDRPASFDPEATLPMSKRVPVQRRSPADLTDAVG